MTAKNVYDIAIHLPDREMRKLLDMLDANVKTINIEKPHKTKKLNDKEAINYLLKNVFRKKG